MAISKHVEILTNQVFGKLTVISFSHTQNNRAYWRCQCKCGGEIVTRGLNLKRGVSTSCKHCKYTDFTGRTINDVFVIGLEEIQIREWKIGIRKVFFWRCRCQCGKIRIIQSDSLKDGFRTICSYKKSTELHHNATHECFTDEEKEAWLHRLRLSHNTKRRCQIRNIEGFFAYEEFNKMCEEYNFICLCCEQKHEKLHADHILPISRGGANTINNIQPLCKPCNSIKHDKYIDYRLKFLGDGI